ncbi:hypothetical protein HWB99_gp110 [Mycobacterium phage DrLupo]|uniref:Uncharacterized protein n=1 Tax=Mycobacterium phage DrLupo TaxID=2499037 RepID=A0A3S9UQT6_9CAUD|nr:hypothetical protein HWB99_gp110 [Mycobacterium phage DrLupo]AZS12646.1 hypothetical protein SEA_DRLUPO_110 [Mycobacterium phage DrLupo]
MRAHIVDEDAGTPAGRSNIVIVLPDGRRWARGDMDTALYEARWDEYDRSGRWLPEHVLTDEEDLCLFAEWLWKLGQA